MIPKFLNISLFVLLEILLTGKVGAFSEQFLMLSYFYILLILISGLMDSLGPWLSNKTRILFNLGMVSHPTSPCSHTKRYIPQQKKYAEIYLSSVNLALNKGLSVISCISDFICTYNKEYDLAIGPDGSIYKCISGIGLERFRVATLEEVMQAPEIFLVKQASFLEMGKGDLTCHKCRFFPVCGGGCVFNAYVAKREKDCWFEFHQVAIPLFVEILNSVQFVEPDVWVRKSNQNGG